MKKLFGIVTIFVAVFAFLTSSTYAAANTKLDLIQDVASGGVGVLDMDGPTGFGFLNYNQNANGDLHMIVSLKDAEPNTTYSGVFLVCGPDHASACDFVDVGDLTTNNQGNGNATMILSASDLYDQFGSGARTDHFDLLKGVGDQSAGVYAASGLNYIVP